MDFLYVINGVYPYGNMIDRNNVQGMETIAKGGKTDLRRIKMLRVLPIF